MIRKHIYHTENENVYAIDAKLRTYVYISFR